jgi:hypothetical protein
MHWRTEPPRVQMRNGMGMCRKSLFEKKDVVCAGGVSVPANGLIGVGPILSIVAVGNAIKSFRITECSNDL